MVAQMSTEAPPAPARLVVLGDSLAFFAGTKALLPDDPRLYPGVLCDELSEATQRAWSVESIARSGWSVLGVWRALRRDEHAIRSRLAGAEAVVVGVGTIDATPVALPGRLGFGVREPEAVRRRTTSRRHRLAWDVFARVYPAAIRCTGARLVHTPTPKLEKSWVGIAGVLSEVAPRAAVCGVVPTIHDCGLYAGSLRHHQSTVATITRVCGALGIPLVDLPRILADEITELPDGMHWTFELHRRVALAMRDTLVPRLVGSGSVAGRPDS